MTIATKLLKRVDEISGRFTEVRGYITAHVPFAMLTAYRSNLATQVNEKRNINLVNDLKRAGFKAIQANGCYQEKGQPVVGDERSFFVPYMGKDEPHFYQQMVALGNKYNQDAILYSNGKEIGEAKRGVFHPQYNAVTFDPAKIEQYWSEIDGHKFAFVESDDE